MFNKRLTLTTLQVLNTNKPCHHYRSFNNLCTISYNNQRFSSSSNNNNKYSFMTNTTESSTATMQDEISTNQAAAVENNNNKKSSWFTELGERMKVYEKEMTLSNLTPNTAFMIRLDGHGFSKFTKKFTKPWDIRVHNAMYQVACGLMKEYHPTMVYTFSDEITLCFPSLPDEEFNEKVASFQDPKSTLPYTGKIQKLVSLSSGLASTLFYKAMLEETQGSPQHQFVVDSTPHFDARIFTVPSNDEIIANLTWRSAVDCGRNSISGMAQAHFPHKLLSGKGGGELKKMLLESKGINYDDEPAWYRYGVYLKKQYYLLDATTPKGDKVTATRTKIVRESFDIRRCPDSLGFLTTKVLPIDFKLEVPDKPKSKSKSTTTTTVVDDQ
ncbi:hypothetical protein DFA_05639 [Cavenderia fasciculata]|uniref:tRNAHis guanylyltransferase catalytic domain-containing protein n=1 Tax=Cavenderia fasciculata TaxID=261658 RepID=F4PLV2_CACFS|nr:uncharacterized protein DFA_05639 [Cavenderia fasciculata]EGG23506.1 hypothetical protein DFA_05639 [Cavenderia fasciculata]|eukprot:XP_004361357.1 hypothetical protein DFA_05639 [Cavenderia fasciculata]